MRASHHPAIWVLCLFFLTCHVQLAQAKKTDINFDDLQIPWGNCIYLTTQYSARGVTFEGTPDADAPFACNNGGYYGYPAFSSPSYLWANLNYNNLQGRIRVVFDPKITGNITKVSARVTGNKNITMYVSGNGAYIGSASTGGANYAGSSLYGPPTSNSPNKLLTVQSSGTSIVSVEFEGPYSLFFPPIYSVDDLTFYTDAFQIIQPKDATQFPLTKNSYTATDPITFEAGPIDASGQIHWTAKLEYQTSGGVGSIRDTREFTTDANSPTHDETYSGIGGKVTVEASQGTPSVDAKPITIYVVGHQIPDADITNRLVDLYGGATPNLMTGIAMREGSYAQFHERTLYGVPALWPAESPHIDGSPSGRYIGLMQVRYSPENAWDWKTNTASAVNLFYEKLAAAGRWEQRIRDKHQGLRPLTDVELEHMAVLLYGPGAPWKERPTHQYYIPARSPSGDWTWVVNMKKNPVGVNYTNDVYDLRR